MDPSSYLKILDLLKARFWPLVGIAAGLIVFADAHHNGMIPLQADGSPDPWLGGTLAAVCVLGGLACSLAIQAVVLKGQQWVSRWCAFRGKARDFERHIPHLSDRERRIFAHLLHHQRLDFETNRSGEHAMGLIERGFLTVLSGAVLARMPERMTVVVPKPVWGVLRKRAADFPYSPVGDAAEGAPPWRRSRGEPLQ